MKTNRSANAIRRFLELQAAGGILLLAASGVALLFANIPGLAGWYQYLLDVPIEIKLGGLELNKNVLLVINDGLMAVFFLLVGLEIKREALVPVDLRYPRLPRWGASRSQAPSTRG
ncbi:MAG: Na+/H+ antiporter NhaA [Planctomycetota bacterium]|jgi:NhaA family Na+:H+ antiporter